MNIICQSMNFWKTRLSLCYVNSILLRFYKCAATRETLRDEQVPFINKLSELARQHEACDRAVAKINGDIRLVEDKKEAAEAEVLTLVADKVIHFKLRQRFVYTL
jgi:hypothetical protein